MLIKDRYNYKCQLEWFESEEKKKIKEQQIGKQMSEPKSTSKEFFELNFN